MALKLAQNLARDISSQLNLPPGPSYEAEESNSYRDESSGPGVFDNLVPLMNLLYPSTIVGGIGLLTMAFYVKQVDDAYNRTLSKFNKVHNNTDYR